MKAILRDRRRAQAGTTLIELLVSLTIAGLALALVIGTISSGLLDATLAKRNTAIHAVLEYEMEQVSGSPFSASAPSYSDCFATERPSLATRAPAYQGTCPTGYSLRADVSRQDAPCSVQTWTIAVSTWPAGSPTGASVQICKVPHR